MVTIKEGHVGEIKGEDGTDGLQPNLSLLDMGKAFYDESVPKSHVTGPSKSPLVTRSFKGDIETCTIPLVFLSR